MMSPTTSPHNLPPTPGRQREVQLPPVPVTPIRQKPSDPQSETTASKGTPTHYRTAVEAVAKPYRVTEFNRQMEDHYSSITPTAFMDQFFGAELKDDEQLRLRSIAKRLKDVPKVETQACYESFVRASRVYRVPPY